MRGEPKLTHAATAVPAAKTSQKPPRPWTLGNAYTSASNPIRPPTAEPPKRRRPFWLLDPMVDSEMTKHVITEV